MPALSNQVKLFLEMYFLEIELLTLWLRQFWKGTNMHYLLIVRHTFIVIDDQLQWGMKKCCHFFMASADCQPTPYTDKWLCLNVRKVFSKYKSDNISTCPLLIYSVNRCHELPVPVLLSGVPLGVRWLPLVRGVSLLF